MTHSLPEPIQVAARPCGVLDACGLRYSIRGSLASSLSGEPRSTLDIDIVVEMSEADVAPVAAALGGSFYVDEDALRRAVSDRSTSNLIEHDSSVKIDLFIAGGTALDSDLLRRRLRVSDGDPPVSLYVHSPEDILLHKVNPG